MNAYTAFQHRYLEDGVASAAVLIHLGVPHRSAQVALAHLCRHTSASHIASLDELG